MYKLNYILFISSSSVHSEEQWPALSYRINLKPVSQCSHLISAAHRTHSHRPYPTPAALDCSDNSTYYFEYPPYIEMCSLILRIASHQMGSVEQMCAHHMRCFAAATLSGCWLPDNLDHESHDVTHTHVHVGLCYRLTLCAYILCTDGGVYTRALGHVISAYVYRHYRVYSPVEQ